LCVTQSQHDSPAAVPVCIMCAPILLVVLIGGLSFHHSSSGFFGQGCQKSLGNSEKDRFNHAEPFILSSLSPSLSENPRIFPEKTFPRIKATSFSGSAETCKLYFK